MATWVTSWASSQSRKAKSSAAVVPKVCTCCSRVPFDPGTRTQAATVCLCTSSPHTRSISRSIVSPPRVVSPVPGGASFARLCSACSMATMRGADSSHVRLFADSRYQLQSTFPGIRRAVSIDDFHDARVCPRLMAIIFGLGLEREKGRQRTTDAMRQRAKAGHVTGGRIFGYDNREERSPEGKRLWVQRVINEGEAAVVRRIF